MSQTRRENRTARREARSDRNRTRKAQMLSKQLQALQFDQMTAAAGPSRKRWTSHDLKQIKPMNNTQEDMMCQFISGRNIVAKGSAGTGKTFIGVWLAMNEVLSSATQVDKVIIVRSAVPSREIGHLPGTIEEKTEIYEAPYADMFHDLFGYAASYKDMKEAGLVEFLTTSFIRGLTWDNAVVVVDECQNMTFHELNSIMTRLGKNSRIILAGDLPQKDLVKKGDVSGMEKLLKVVNRMGGFDTINFTRHDIVRSSFVKSWITAVEDVEAAEPPIHLQ